MKLFRRLFHPLITFIVIQIVWILLLVSWIYWFIGRHQQLKALAIKYQVEWLPETSDWLILTEGILLLVAILIGIYVIFLYWRRQASLNRAQRHFINQVTHELKSPLASIQLHLETIQMRQPSPEQLQQFVLRMQGDSERLNGLISNLLTANKVEHRGAKLNLQQGNFSQMIEEYLAHEHEKFQEFGDLRWEIEPGLNCRFDVDAIETVMRNLLENATFYTHEPPVVVVTLRRNGSMAHLSFRDQGYGIPRKFQKKVFRIFYRIRHTGKTIRGTGIGLFIVRNVIRLHGGKVWIESIEGGKGTTFHLMIPLTEELHDET
ncbi:histidine kinase [Desulfuromusa kysingii]|uniref:histidine kinase n=1 Tax=Desulfuromusa kysingii TaxID=37625 RepID=A0A1H3W5A8_9BACT|nr:HAMP domain-containing sensor histidine kinase [Desulfuromusa kysingii]SDZ81532.1 histidine kinase [Desulfuromusa kysingii]